MASTQCANLYETLPMQGKLDDMDSLESIIKETCDFEPHAVATLRVSSKIHVSKAAGIEPGPILQDFGSWDLNMLGAEQQWGNQTLVEAAIISMKSLNLANAFQLDEQQLRHFFGQLTANYSTEQPYHNAVHAADVTQTVAGIFLRDERLRKLTSPEQQLALMLAAPAHDMVHNGRTNAFHVATNTPIAQLYQGVSVEENLSADILLDVLAENNILQHLPEVVQVDIKRMTVCFILETDMTAHGELVKSVTALLAEKRDDLGGWDSSEAELLCGYILHASDIGNAAKTWKISAAFGSRCHDEFGAQADEMRQLLHDGLWPDSHMGQLQIPSFAESAKFDGVAAQLRTVQDFR